MIDATQLLAPRGPLESALFPKTDSNVLAAELQVALDQAYADERVTAATPTTKRDRMAKALALNGIYMRVYQRMLSEPLTVNQTDKGSHGYSTKQIDGMKALADEQLAIFVELLPVETVTPRTIPPTSARICLTF